VDEDSPLIAFCYPKTIGSIIVGGTLCRPPGSAFFDTLKKQKKFIAKALAAFKEIEYETDSRTHGKTCCVHGALLDRVNNLAKGSIKRISKKL